MKIELLSSPETLRRRLARYIANSEEIYCAVAWATTNQISNDLLNNQDKIKKLIIGTHFFQTDPEILKQLGNCPQLRVALNGGAGVFHPKLYLFYQGTKATALVGSANFTRGALTANKEAMLCLNGLQEESVFIEIQETIEGYWKEGVSVDDNFLDSYVRQYKAMQKHRKALATKTRIIRPADNAPHPTLLSLSWEKFSHLVRNEEHHVFQGRINILSESIRLFLEHRTFEAMPTETRRALAGILRAGSPHIEAQPKYILDWGWFGSMIGAGVFKNRINENDQNISLALDCITSRGEIQQFLYQSITSTKSYE